MKPKRFVNILCFALLVCICAALEIACSNSNQTAAVDNRKNEYQEKQKQKAQREEDLKLFGTKLNEFVSLAPPEKLDSPPYLKGKAVIVNVGDGGVIDSFYYGYELTDPEIKLVYPNSLASLKKDIWNKNFGVRSLAEKPDDAQTVIQLKFRDTGVCQWYGGASDDYEKGTRLCGEKADVTVIDNTIPAVIAKKTFVNNKLPKKLLASKDKELNFYVAESFYQMYPFQDIEDYHKTFEQR